MRDLTKLFALTLVLASPALAEDAKPAETPAAPAAEAPAADANAIGASYTASTHDDWTVKCIRTAEGKDPCEIYQVLKTAEGNPLADISITSLPAGQEGAAGITVMTPLETLLTAGVAIQIDDKKPVIYPFTFCAQPGCFARIGITQAELDGFSKGNAGKISVVPVAKPDARVEASLSLKGFTAAFDAAKAANEKAAAAAKPAQ